MKKTIKNENIWRLNNTLLNVWMKPTSAWSQQITEEIKICIETNENENTTTQNLWDSVKAVLRGKVIAIQTYLNVIRKDAWDDFNLFEFAKARFMAQDVVYPGECSVSI